MSTSNPVHCSYPVASDRSWPARPIADPSLELRERDPLAPRLGLRERDPLAPRLPVGRRGRGRDLLDPSLELRERDPLAPRLGLWHTALSSAHSS